MTASTANVTDPIRRLVATPSKWLSGEIVEGAPDRQIGTSVQTSDASAACRRGTRTT